MALTVTFAISAGIGTYPLNVTFTPTISGGTYVKTRWLFGDGFESTESSPTHTYLMAGSFSVKLIVSGTDSIEYSHLSAGAVVVFEQGLLSGSWSACFLDTSFSLGMNSTQGIGFSKNSGISWPIPPAETGAVTVWDALDQYHLLVYDSYDGYHYDITTRDGVTNSGLVCSWKDKDTTDIIPKIRFVEDTGTGMGFRGTQLRGYEHYFLGLIDAQVYTRPTNEISRYRYDPDVTNKYGYPAGLQLTLNYYADGEPTVASASAAKISLPKHCWSFDRTLKNAHRLQLEVVANKGNWLLVGRHCNYELRDIPDDPTANRMSERAYQLTLSSNLLYWVTRGSKLVDRISGKPASAHTYGFTAGPDGKPNSAFDAYTDPFFNEMFTFNNPYIANAWLVFWVNTTWPGDLYENNLPGDANNFQMAADTYNDLWQLFCYVGPIPANMLLYGMGIFFDMRIYSTPITIDILNYLCSDVKYNAGRNTLPIW